MKNQSMIQSVIVGKQVEQKKKRRDQSRSVLKIGSFFTRTSCYKFSHGRCFPSNNGQFSFSLI